MRRINLKPKTVFLIDGLGATLTAILLITVLRTFNKYFGMPPQALTILSIAALILVIYSFSCFLFSNDYPQRFLRPLIVANLTYCLSTLGFVIYYSDRLTTLGFAYFIGEVLIICGVVHIELNALNVSRRNSR